MRIHISSTATTVYKFSQPFTHDYSYHENRVDIWKYALHEEEIDACTLLDKEELERANRYYFAKHRRRFIMARATLRLILSRYLNIDPKQILFTHNAYGKPMLVNEPSLHFNLSHSKDVALLAIGKSFPVGIDLEFFSARPYEGIGQQMFSSHENHTLQQTPNTLKALAFFHIWAQKEAFIKACGLGLSYPTQQFDVPSLPPTNGIVFDSLHQSTWHMQSFMPEVACCAALCHHPSIGDIRYFSLEASPNHHYK